ncbi:SPARC-related modular calcium-binding protein 2 isoform X2 [Eurosta solidaginis]|uniref:SPARC-related modular calcium-binding protein 2 isoform X2 n=1 Tax=Eurosta solidaginis TaxID=178769 RepID=UPI0035312D10
MYISSFIVVCLCAVAELGLTANVPARREQHELTISECAARGGECDETKGRPVCGTDDRTYPSRCHLLRVQCSGHQVSLKYRGPCKACKEARDYALKHKSRNPPKFIPRCKPDGTYAAVQCLGDTGCWCSDITGKPIENTSVRNGKPKCREYTKANIRRSPARHLSPSRGRRTCTSIDRAAFNANLIKVFQSEYIRAGQQKQGGQLTTNGAVGGGSELGYATANDKPVLDWKFTYLDANANQMLDKNEFRELKKLVKRAVKPRRCGRAFGKFCDLDDDDRLTLTEWNNCFSKDEINHLNPKTEPQFNESESESDCLADQKTALEEQRHGGTLFYVPECTADGRYQRVQCYHSTPYCWCVHEDTGKNIPGTSVKDKRPQCDAIYAAPRPMKGCPEPRKTLFLNDLKEFLKTHIVASASSGGNTTKWHSEDERVATLSFVLLDKNKNKAWERKEWKLFREMVTNTKTLRKCGKKMPRYCDVNSDKKITLTEWLNCLETQRKEMQTSLQSSTEADIYTTSKPKNLTGSNPLEQYLKD